MVIAALLACTGGDTGDPVDTGDTDEVVDPGLCDGLDCELRFDEVTLPATHNSMSNADEGWWFPNQAHGLERQLQDGIRGFLIDTHDNFGVASLCHGNCALGSEPLVDGLRKFEAFLAANPSEVVVLVVQNETSTAAVVDAFEASGLAARAWAQPAGEPWPALGELAGRVVAFSEADEDGPDWWMPFYGHGWDNDYAAKRPEDLDCDVLRGSREHPLFLQNHFLTDPLASPELAAQVNHDPFLSDRIAACEAESGDIPNLVAVDFYDVGDLLAAVRAANERR